MYHVPALKINVEHSKRQLNIYLKMILLALVFLDDNVERRRVTRQRVTLFGPPTESHRDREPRRWRVTVFHCRQRVTGYTGLQVTGDLGRKLETCLIGSVSYVRSG